MNFALCNFTGCWPGGTLASRGDTLQHQQPNAPTSRSWRQRCIQGRWWQCPRALSRQRLCLYSRDNSQQLLTGYEWKSVGWIEKGSEITNCIHEEDSKGLGITQWLCHCSRDTSQQLRRLAWRNGGWREGDIWLTVFVRRIPKFWECHSNVVPNIAWVYGPKNSRHEYCIRSVFSHLSRSVKAHIDGEGRDL